MNKDVLIPQPDTEILVQAVIKYINHITRKEISGLFENLETSKKSNPKVLDLCTGSGAIAISLAKNFNNELSKIKEFGSESERNIVVL